LAHVVDRPTAELARAALNRHDWQAAFDMLEAADAAGGLTAEELGLLADAAWWVGRLSESTEARERAFAANLRDGNMEFAAANAAQLSGDSVVKGANSLAAAWLNRGERLLEGRPESFANGLLAVMRGFKEFFDGEIEASLADAERAAGIARRLNDRGLEVFAMNGQGQGLIALGRVQEGLEMLDDAAVAAVSGELEPRTAGVVYCSTIGACAALGDWGRAAQWTEAQDRWCKREQITGFPGMCRLHRAEIKRLRGSWLEAEAEARRASEELQSYMPLAVPAALYEIGEIRLRRGDLAGAEEVLQRAHALGREPEPALSLVRLAAGRTQEAAASIRRAVDNPSRTPSWYWAPPGTSLWRVALLPAQVEIALANGDLGLARQAADELAALSATYSTTSIRASTACAVGTVELAEGRLADAVTSLRSGLDLWTELDAPYEAAGCRMALAQAYAADGDPNRAAMELRAAREVFAALGALPSVGQADEALAALESSVLGPVGHGAGGAGARVLKAFMFTDIVDSTRLVEVLGDDGWEHLSRWHDDTLRSLIAQHGGEEVKTIGDGFFAAFAAAADAVRCAVAIQRELVAHRRASGFALNVRIGIHAAEASQRGMDYSGRGVNEAARIGALATGGQILVSASSVTGSSIPYGISEPRTVTLKGISKPVDVVAVEWN
jgi:class 3 adenylate cyclase